MSKRLVITVGGTGGHIYPALALSEQVGERHPDVEVLFVGGRLSKNQYFLDSSAQFKEVTCSPSLKRFDQITLGTWQSRKILQKFQPHVVVGFGSYYTLPTLLAACISKVPVFLHEGNAYPGKINRLFSRFASCTGLHFSEAAKHLRGRSEVVGMPLRKELSSQKIVREESCSYFGLDAKKKTLLIFGGSQGAEAINRTACQAIPNHCQVIHITGQTSFDYEKHYRERGITACVKPFETIMQAAWTLADVATCRAGAGTLAELNAFSVPAILIPFPNAADNHQEWNADWMVKQGGAIKILEHNLTIDLLACSIQKQLSDVVVPRYSTEKSLIDLILPHLIKEAFV